MSATGTEATYRILKSFKLSGDRADVRSLAFSPRISLWRYPWATTPTLVGVVDYVYLPGIFEEGPSVHFTPLGEGRFYYANLGVNHRFGFVLAKDEPAHRRRTIFAVGLPSDHQSYAITFIHHLGGGGNSTNRIVTKAGFLAKRGRYWSLSPKQLSVSLENRVPASTWDGLVFVGGAPKSGTTWVQLILNSHPHILCTGEGNFFGLIGAVHNLQHNEWLPPNASDEYCYDLANISLFRLFVDFYRDISGCKLIADKSPGNALQYGRILEMWPTARIVHCTRDPLDVLVSRLHHEIALMRDGATSEMHAFRDQIASVAEVFEGSSERTLSRGPWMPLLEQVLAEWLQSEESAAAAKRVDTRRVAIVAYEKLLKDPHRVVRNLYHVLGVQHGRRIVDTTVRACSFTHLTGRQRGQEDRRSFFRSGLAGGYRRYLADEVIDWAKSMIDRSRPVAHAAKRSIALPGNG